MRFCLLQVKAVFHNKWKYKKTAKGSQKRFMGELSTLEEKTILVDYCEWFEPGLS